MTAVLLTPIENNCLPRPWIVNIPRFSALRYQQWRSLHGRTTHDSFPDMARIGARSRPDWPAEHPGGATTMLSLRLAERWERLRDAGLGIYLMPFILLGILTALCLTAVLAPMFDPQGCMRIGTRALMRNPCSTQTVSTSVFFGGICALLFGYSALRILPPIFVEIAKPLQTRPFSPALRLLLNLSPMRIVRTALTPGQLELELLWLDADDQPQRRFVLLFEGIERFEFYPHCDPGQGLERVFSAGALVRLYRLDDLSGLEYSRIEVDSRTQLELEVTRYSVEHLPL